MDDDITLLSRYAKDGSEPAFTELVQRHLGFVYNAALRRVRGAHRAEDVAQVVFTDLARKASVVARRSDLIGWLHTSTHFAAAKLMRSEQRREIREHAALTLHAQETAPSEIDWEQIRPVLDEALWALPARDREAVLLRYFQVLPFAEIGNRLGLGEDAARMRVDRAVKALRDLLARRGVTSSAAALATVLAQQPVVAVPAGLTGVIASQALAAASSGGLLAGAIAAIFGLMSTTKTVVIVGSVIAILAGAAFIFQSREIRRVAAIGTGYTSPLTAKPRMEAKQADYPVENEPAGVVASLPARPSEAEQARSQLLFEETLAWRKAKDAVKKTQDQARLAKRPTLDPAASSSSVDQAPWRR